MAFRMPHPGGQTLRLFLKRRCAERRARPQKPAQRDGPGSSGRLGAGSCSRSHPTALPGLLISLVKREDTARREFVNGAEGHAQSQ